MFLARHTFANFRYSRKTTTCSLRRRLTMAGWCQNGWIVACQMQHADRTTSSTLMANYRYCQLAWNLDIPFFKKILFLLPSFFEGYWYLVMQKPSKVNIIVLLDHHSLHQDIFDSLLRVTGAFRPLHVPGWAKAIPWYHPQICWAVCCIGTAFC